MSALLYIACCMGISFVVGLVLGMRIGWVAGLDHGEQQVRAIAKQYNDLRNAIMRERAVRAKEAAQNG